MTRKKRKFAEGWGLLKKKLTRALTSSGDDSTDNVIDTEGILNKETAKELSL